MGVACGLALLLSTEAPEARAEDKPIDEATRHELRAVRKVKLEIRQDYQRDEDEEDGGMRPLPKPVGEAKGFLPLLALATDVVKLAGWKPASAGEEGDVILRVDVIGKPLRAYYASITPGGPAGSHYTGARLSGKITLEKGDTTLLMEEFEAMKPVQDRINRSYVEWSDAPFQELLSEYCEGVSGLLGRVLGSSILVAGLENNNPSIRTGALRALVTLGDPSAAPAFIRLLGDKAEDISRLAAWGAGALGAPEALPALLAALRTIPPAPSDVDGPGRRGWLEISLERESPEHRVEWLKQQFSDYESTLDRRHAILWALMQIDAPEKKERLRSALNDPGPAEFRANAVLLLGWSEGSPAREALHVALSDSDALVRAAALVAIQSVGGDGPTEPLLKAASDDDAMVRGRAREALEEAQRKRWDNHVVASRIQPAYLARGNREFLTAALGHADPLIRAEALQTVVEVGVRDYLPAIREIARQDKLPFLRHDSLEVLTDQHDPQSIEAVIACLTDAVPFVRRQALAVLSGAASEWEQSAPPPLPGSVVAPLLALPSAERTESADAILGILQRVEGPAGVQEIERMARAAGPVTIRRQAVKHLAATRPHDTLPLLLELAGTTDGELALVVGDCLVEINQPDALDPLIALLKADRMETRRLAAHLLGRMRQPRAVGPLIAALQISRSPGPNSDEQLAGAASRALQALTGRNFLTAEEWRKWWKENAGHLRAN